MSNFDHQLEPDAVQRLESGDVLAHSAWHFHGTIVFRGGIYVEWVRRYHSVICRHTADTLNELCRDVNDNHGWD